jgi:hypothetical protein
MDRIGLLEHKNVGYATVIIILIATVILFNPTIFPQESTPTKGTYPTEPEPVPIYITNFGHSPSLPTPANDVSISVKASGATLVILYYDYTDNPTGEPLRLSMVAGASSMWYGEIPRKDHGISVSYWVKASNDDTTKSSSINSYTSLTPEEVPQEYDATFIIYKDVDGIWEEVLLYGELSGQIKIDLTVVEGAVYVTRAVIRFFCLVDDVWTEQEEIAMVSKAGTTDQYWTTYDTTKLANNLYDVRYELFDVNGVSLFTESLFSAGDTSGEGIDPIIIQLGLVGVIAIAILIVLFKKRQERIK